MVGSGILVLLVACFAMNNVQAAPDFRFIRQADCIPVPHESGNVDQCNSWKVTYSVNCASFPPIPGPSSGQGTAVHPSDEEIQQIVDAHNKYRAEAGATEMATIVSTEANSMRINPSKGKNFFRVGTKVCILLLQQQLLAAN